MNRLVYEKSMKAVKEKCKSQVPRAQGVVSKMLVCLTNSPKSNSICNNKEQRKAANPQIGEAGTRERLAFFV